MHGINRFILAVFLLVGLETLFAVPKLSWELAMPGREGLGTVVALAVAGLAGFFVWRAREPLRARLAQLAERLARVPRRRWLAGLLIAGVLLRLAYALTFPAPQVADARTYYALGAKLAQGEPYITPRSGTRAEWPPGLPFLLAGTFQLTGIGRAGVVLLNLALFTGLLLTTYLLARRLVGEGAARLATLLLAFWPNLIASVGLATKEAVGALALTLAFLLYRQDQDAPSAGRLWLSRLGAGLALGYATLAQPALLLLPSAFVLADLAGRVPLRRSLPSWALLAAGMSLVIAPWIIRNHAILGRPVLSTNGGMVFYRGNNPVADGGFNHGTRPIGHLSELEASDTGYRWGMEWIRENPDRFLELAVRKQILFLGDDAVGIYETLKNGLGMGGAFYAALKLLASGWWWLLWLLILVGLTGWWRARQPLPASLLLLLLSFLCIWTIDSVFESGSRHHVPLVGAIAVLACLSARPLRHESG